MSKQNLKQKLKAADRRRRRRPVAVGVSSQSSPRRVDIAALIASAILSHADSSDQEISDPVVVSAIRSSLSGLAATGEQSKPLSERLEQIAQREDVTRREFRSALQQMLDLAKQHQSPTDRQSFIRYLAMLAG